MTWEMLRCIHRSPRLGLRCRKEAGHIDEHRSGLAVWANWSAPSWGSSYSGMKLHRPRRDSVETYESSERDLAEREAINA